MGRKTSEIRAKFGDANFFSFDFLFELYSEVDFKIKSDFFITDLIDKSKK